MHKKVVIWSYKKNGTISNFSKYKITKKNIINYLRELNGCSNFQMAAQDVSAKKNEEKQFSIIPKKKHERKTKEILHPPQRIEWSFQMAAQDVSAKKKQKGMVSIIPERKT